MAPGVGDKQLDEELPANAIELLLDEKTVNDAVVEILTQSEDLFDHNGRLAIVQDRINDDGNTQAKIHALCLPGCREIISDRCRFYTWGTAKETGEEVLVWQRIPRWLYEGVFVRGYWQGIRPLRGIVNCPVLRPDGSVVQTAGYDPASALYVDLLEEFPQVPDNPSTDQIQAAAALLRDVVCDFPFKTAPHLSAWVAAVLTPIAREAYRGPTSPLFLIDSNVRGSGKSLLGDIVALIVEGREAIRFASPQNDEECRKRITAHVESDDQVILIDNIVGVFGWASFDAALTGTWWKDRRLGHTGWVNGPLRMTFLGTGNNVMLAADTARRVCHIRLESRLENPENRQGFKHLDILKHVRQHRPALLTAALTILRGFIAAGRPDMNLNPWGSFQGWSDLVRQAVVFAGFDDPGKTREELRETSDSEAGALHQLLESISSIDTAKRGLSAGEMIQIAMGHVHSYSTHEAATLREAIEQFCDGSFDRIDSRRLGNRLKHFRNRVCGGMSFDFTTRQGNRYWFVQLAGDSGGSGGSHTSHLSAGKKTDVQQLVTNAPEIAHWEAGDSEPPEPPEPPLSDFEFEFGA